MALTYLKGTEQACIDYNDYVSEQRNLPAGTVTGWARPVEREGEYYIRKHPDYPATSGLIEAELPEPERIDGII